MGANINPIDKEPPSLISRWFFCWMFPMCWTASHRDLEEHDLARARHKYDSQKVGDKLEQNWLLEEAACQQSGRKPSFMKVILKTFWWDTIPGAFLQLIYVAIRTVTPLLFAQLLSYWSVNTTTTRTEATYYAGGMILGNWVAAFCNYHGNLLGQQAGMKMRIATSTLMYRKIMRMDNGSLGETTAGKVVNLLSNDLSRFDLAMTYMHYIWIIPLQLGAVFYLGYVQAGVAAFVGIVSLAVIGLPLQGFLTRFIGKFRLQIAGRTDERIKVMSEVINGIQVIKMYAWEIPFEKVVREKRNTEMDVVKKATYVRAVFLGFMIFTERMAVFCAILAYILMGNSLSANVIYPLQQFMSAIQVNITLILPFVLAFMAELIAAFGRVQDFMSTNDRADLSPLNNIGPGSVPIFRNTKSRISNRVVQPLSYGRKSSVDAGRAENAPANKPGQPRYSRSMSIAGADMAIEVRDVSCSWTGDPENLALKNLSFRLKKGKLCAVIGPVGSGKSSLLQLLLKELTPSAGFVAAFGTMSYASQEPWLFSATVRENILFGLPYEAEKYKRVCKVCALEKDFKQFTYGDQTLVGERGVSMSGGQRARLNLARSVYRDCDIYLLDDPLSAVDANVGRQLFEGCINGYLRQKTRVLVTHQIHFLKAADYIVVLNNGVVENMGTFDELVTSGKEFTTMLAQLQEGKDKDSESIRSGGSIEERRRSSKAIQRLSLADKAEIEEFQEQKIQAEERQSGNLKWEVLSEFFKAAGICVTLVSLLLVMMSIISAGGAEYWISYWTNQVAAYEEENGVEIEPGLDMQIGLFTTKQYLIIHAVIVGVCLLVTNIRVIPFAALCTNASRTLHDMMFTNMLRGVMRFFDTSTSGRILNRFTKDMGALDELLPRTLLDVMQVYSMLAAVLVLNAIAMYYTLIPSFVLLVLFTLFLKVYMKTAQGIKRMEGTAKSPVFGMVTSSLNGIATIRSSGAETRLIAEFDRAQDVHTCAWYGYLGGGSSFSFYLDTLCLIYLGSVILVCIYLDFDGLVPVGSVGLVVTQSNALTAMLQYGARMLVEFIAQLTSVERVLEYTKIENEANLFDGLTPTPDDWPSQGSIEFKNVSMRYVEDEPPVLKNLDIRIEPGWKVGIVGRTGAGKSSLISAMFRFAYLDGEMIIDGVDTALVARQHLRSKISIIPQEPVLFSASIRYNLDPFDIYSDEELWRALEQVEMKSAVPSLDFKVTEGGANFSVGQRQLMCLARAVLRSNKILIMDEATANVDPQTDQFIQSTIRREFAKCTVLTIAHRLNTVMDSDRVLVMDGGRVSELEHPYVLLSDPNSALSAMVRETGPKMAAQLLEIARDSYFQSNLKENVR